VTAAAGLSNEIYLGVRGPATALLIRTVDRLSIAVTKRWQATALQGSLDLDNEE